MPFDSSNLPEWNKEGIEPPQLLKDGGWGAGSKPPADYFNWFFNKVFKSLQNLFSNAQDKSEKGKANGYASLNESGKVPADQISIDTSNLVTEEELNTAETNAKTYSDQNKVDKTALGVAGGVATLGTDGKVPASQLNVSSTADKITITDTGGYFTAENAEGALQEVGQALNAMRGSLITSVNNTLGM